MVDTGVYVAARTLLDRLVLELAGTRAGAACTAVVHPTACPTTGWSPTTRRRGNRTWVMMIADGAFRRCCC
uniref:hypothetical protein n=1 Tax=Micromonospora sp. NBC_00855 TaxID=2975978 RepID=UPI0037C9C83C|nr:hypothetical protein OHB51_35675 [Micromonospora sp. NBC_00855]